MYVVTVEFKIKSKHSAHFRQAIRQQAQNSLSLETDCHQFDVCLDPEDDTKIFLYEVYSDSDAFQRHLKSDHFITFDATVNDWVEHKSIYTWVKE
jgi:quinol monooxygenase YgiN